jgi:hypothetical protein
VKVNYTAISICFLGLAIFFYVWINYGVPQKQTDMGERVSLLEQIHRDNTDLAKQQYKQKVLMEEIANKTKWFKNIAGLAADMTFTMVSIRECCKSFPGDSSQKECAKFFDKRESARIHLAGQEDVAELVFCSGAKEAIQKFIGADAENGDVCPVKETKVSISKELFSAKRQELIDFFIDNIHKDQEQLKEPSKV